MLQITYQKRNGIVFKRLRDTTPPYKIGDNTSMGWKVLKIEYEYKGSFYPSYEYYKLIEKEKQKIKKKMQLKTLFKKGAITLLYYLIGLFFYNLINIYIRINMLFFL